MGEIHIYTDGACSGNPGPGGWGAVIHKDGAETQEIFGGIAETTNNRMELTATIKGIETILADPSTAHIHTDSTYVKDGITLWVKNWQKNGWKTAAKKPVKNQDLWQDLVAVCDKKPITWHWVKGHSGHPDNERADMLARNGVMQIMMKAAISDKLKTS